MTSDNPNDHDDHTFWRSFDYQTAFVGLDADECNDTDLVWWHGGNSVLLQLRGSAQENVSIGSEIFSFKPPDEILRYVSTMGNSAVPYPYAVGKEFTYFTIEDAFLPNTLLELDEDPYGKLYSMPNTKGAGWR